MKRKSQLYRIQDYVMHTKKINYEVIFSENDCLRTKLDLRLRKKYLTKTITKNKQATFSNQFFSQNLAFIQLFNFLLI